MKTPKEYTQNLKNGIITAEMLSDCIFSCNKRAKNWRDKEAQLHRYWEPSPCSGATSAPAACCWSRGS